MTTINRRILVIDDHRAIHDDFRKILAPPPLVSPELEDLEAEMFGDAGSKDTDEPEPETFEVHSAYQGQDGFTLVKDAEEKGTPFAMAFVDVRMPPGWDGIETIAHLWQASPGLQTVICTAYSDYAWEEIVEKLGKSEGVLMLRKPFDPVEIRGLACKLTEEWSKARGA